MNIKEAIEIAMKRAEGVRGDYDKKMMYHYADVAQKRIAHNRRHIERVMLFNVEDGSGQSVATIGNDFYKMSPKGVIRCDDEERPVRCRYIGEGKVLFKKGEKGSFAIHYYAQPRTITADTEDTYEFETAAETHEAIPFYIAYELSRSDDPDIAQVCLDEFDRHMAQFADEPFVVKKEIENHYALR